MDYSKFKVPYIGNLEIKNRAEKFRERYWNKILPIDIEKIIDVFLEINIIPIPELAPAALRRIRYVVWLVGWFVLLFPMSDSKFWQKCF